VSASTSRRWRAGALIALAAVATALTVTDLQWDGRTLVSVAFHLLVPGCAVVSWRKLDDPLTEVTLGVALSIAIGTGVALAMIAIDRWEPAVAQVGLAVASTPLLVPQVRGTDHGAGDDAVDDADDDADGADDSGDADDEAGTSR